MSAQPKPLAIFDCDGTLVDSGATIHRALDASLRHHGLECPPREEAQRVIGLSLVEAMKALVPDADHDALAETYKEAFVDLRERGEAVESPYDGIPDLLTAFANAGWTLAVATGKSEKGLRHVLDLNGWSDRFACLHTADGHPSKPNPSMIFSAMNECYADPKDTVMIGDTSHDMRMARNARVGAIGVAWGYHPVAELEEGGAHAIAGKAEDVLTLAQAWRAGAWWGGA
ncbi:HAD-IA family hydrolase [Sphingomicrobium sp. XHP0239]|uniref:HAD-IA family hydrolase n=1 Tax=Sphingomicrobium maritimum TaxID=3133972 RepID=UPI0031CCD88C